MLKKVKWVLVIVCVFMVILATNLLDHKNFLRVEESVDNIYNERLVAKELLLDISIKFHEKEMAYALKDTNYLQTKNDVVNKLISETLNQFSRSKITRKEEYLIDDLKNNHEKLIRLEANSKLNYTPYTAECSTIFSEISSDINELANEQMLEGNHQKRLATDAVNSVKMFSKIEIYTLIFLALLLMVIVLYNPKTSEVDED